MENETEQGTPSPGAEPPVAPREAANPAVPPAANISQPTVAMGAATVPSPATRRMAALRHRNFRLFWGGQLISLTGTWMQSVAQSWLVLVITNSPLALGVVSTLQFLPTLLFSLFGGVLADRLPRRSVLIATQATSALLALTLGLLTASGVVQMIHVIVIATLSGFVNALDGPTRQAFVVDLVSREDLPNAIALNSSVFNAARMIGPAVAGLAIGAFGLSSAFLLNAASFLPVILGLYLIRPRPRSVPPSVQTSVWANLKEGLLYVYRTPLVRFVVIFIGVVSTFGLNFGILVPVLARQHLYLEATGYGFLMSGMGLGSLTSALLLATLHWRPTSYLICLGGLAFGLLEVMLVAAGSFAVALVLLFLIGSASVFFTTVANTILQTTTPDPLRGRVMSVYTLVFLGTMPLASPVVGAAAEVWGVGVPLLVGGLVSILVAVFSLWTKPWVGSASDNHE